MEGQFYKANKPAAPAILLCFPYFVVGLCYSIHSEHNGITLCRYTQPTTYFCSTWALWTHCSALCFWCSLLPHYSGAGPCPALSMASCSLYFILSRCGQSVDLTATATMLSLPLYITAPSSAPERYEHVEVEFAGVCRFLAKGLFF